MAIKGNSEGETSKSFEQRLERVEREERTLKNENSTIKEYLYILTGIVGVLFIGYFVILSLTGFVVLDFSSGSLSGATLESKFSHVTVDPTYLQQSGYGLVAYYPFDGDNIAANPATTAYDYSANGLDGTYTGNAAVTSSGCQYGRCLTLDGTGDYVTLTCSGNNLPIGINPWSAFTWVKFGAWTSSEHSLGIFTLGGDSQNGIFFNLVGGPSWCSGTNGLDFAVTGSSHNCISVTGLDNGNWHHVGLTYNGTDIELYSDDVSVGLISVNLNLACNRLDTGLANGGFNGQMDEVMLFNESLSAQQIADIYANTSNRFVGPGTHTFTVDLGTNTTANITLGDYVTPGGTIIKAQINSSTTAGSIVIFSNGVITNYTLPSGDLTSATLKIIYVPDNTYYTDNSYYLSNPHNFLSPIAGPNVTVDGYSAVAPDTTAPTVSIAYPANMTYNSIISQLNYTVSDETALSVCWYSLNSGVTNTTITCGTNVTGLTASQGSNTWIVYANDTSNNINSSSVIFNVDSLNPSLVFSGSTPSDGSTQTNATIPVQLTTSDANPHYSLVNFDSSLVGWWRFEGNVNDELGVNNGVTTGVLTSTAGKFGNAYNFNGINTNVNTSSFSYPSFSASVWFNPSSLINGSNILNNDFRGTTLANGNSSWQLRLRASDATQLLLCIGNTTDGSCFDSVSQAQTGMVSAGNWYHAVVTYDGTTGNASLYFNGTLQFSAIKINMNSTVLLPLVIGRDWITVTRFFNGTIDEVMVFNRSLSSQEALALYNAGTNQYSKTFTAGNGAHSITGYAIDSFGNKNTTETRTVTVVLDTTAPTISFVSPTTSDGTSSLNNFIYSLIEANDVNYKNYSYSLYNSTSLVSTNQYYSEDLGVSGGDIHTCALLNTGNTTCWGNNYYGQSNNYTSGDAIAVSAGNSRTCMLLNNNNIICRGLNGNGESANYTSGNAIGLATGDIHTCALLNNGNVICWGENSYGQSNNYTQSNAVGISAGIYHSCALLNTGNITCWGRNNNGQSNNYTQSNAVGISAGSYHTCALLNNGNVICWGENSYGQSNNYTSGNAIGVTASGQYHSCALLNTGNITCWGRNNNGQSNNYTQSNALGVAAGDDHTCALLNTGNITCWGLNTDGQAGNYTLGNTKKQAFYAFQSLSSGTYYLNATSCDSSNNCNSTGTRTITALADTTAPTVSIAYPANTTYNSIISQLNYTVSDTNLQSCKYSLNGAANVSITCGTNVTGLTASQGSNTWIVYANDTSNNVNSSSITFTADTIAPSISFVSPTPADSSIQSNSNVYVNLSSSDISQHYSLVNLDGSLVGLWRFENNPNDDSGSSNTGTWSGTERYSAGKFGSSAKLDGSSYISTPITNLSGSELTISYWFNGTNLQSAIRQQEQAGLGRYIVTGWGGSCLNILYNDGQLSGLSVDGLGDNCASIYDGNWHHLVLTWKQNTPDIGFDSYLDGNLVANKTSSDNSIPNMNTSVRFGSSNGEGEFTNGSIDEVMIFRRALSAPEVKSLYNAQSTQYENNFTGLSDGAHSIKGYAVDTSANLNSTNTRSITIDATSPAVNITYPANTTYNSIISQLNYTVSDNVALSTCAYSTDNGVTNTTITCGTNVTGLTASQGSNTWGVGVNDTSNNLNISSITFFVDSISPTITYGTLTETDASTIGRSNVVVNVTSVDSNLANITIRLYNSARVLLQSNTSSSSSYRINYTGLSDGIYYFNATATDILNNQNNSGTRSVTIDTTNPGIVYGTRTENNNEFSGTTSIYTNVSSADTNFANITFSLYNLTTGTATLVNSTSYATSVSNINWTGLVSGVYQYQINITDIANNKNATTIRNITLLPSCLAQCTEGNDCNVTNSCYLYSSMCSGNICDFGNFRINGTLYTLYQSNGDANELFLNVSNITFIKSTVGNRGNYTQGIVFNGKAGSTISPGTRGGNAGLVNVTVPYFFNTTRANFTGLGGYSTLSGIAGGNGGQLYMQFFGLIRNFSDGDYGASTVRPRLPAGGSLDSGSGTTGAYTLGKIIDCSSYGRVDVDVDSNGAIDNGDSNLIGIDHYNNVTSDNTFSSVYDISCDGKLNVIEISKIGFQIDNATVSRA